MRTRNGLCRNARRIPGGSRRQFPSVVVLTPAAPRTFVPDYSFAGSSLTDWRAIGQRGLARREGGIIGTPKSTAGDG